MLSKEIVNKISGSIFVYNNNGCISFCNNVNSNINIILIGGLGDNIMTIPYIHKLNELCIKKNYCLIISQLSSMPEFKIISIEQDIYDINCLLNHLEGSIILLGHSTGCQDILLYCEKNKYRNVKGIILQGPVSDIEFHSNEIIKKHENIINNNHQNHSLYFEYNGNIWLKERFESLYKKNGIEDIFSSYLADESYEKWKDLDIKILSIISEKDEYCVTSIVNKLKLMSEVIILKDADHCISKEFMIEDFINVVDEFIISLNISHN